MPYYSTFEMDAVLFISVCLCFPSVANKGGLFATILMLRSFQFSYLHGPVAKFKQFFLVPGYISGIIFIKIRSAVIT